MSETEHTPTPWRIDREAGGAGYAIVAHEPKRKGGTNRICTVRPANRSDEAYDEAEDNAAFIVKAVNAHGPLVEALTELLERHTALVNSGDCGNWDPEKEPAVIAARAALGAK